MRTTTSSDVAQLRRVVSEAFVTDPLLQWIFPDEENRLDAVAAWLGRFVEGYVSGGRVDAVEEDGALRAAALWRWPGDDVRSPGPPSVSGLLVALIGTERFEEVRSAFEAMVEGTPHEPHAYLHFLAVSPDHQRRGLGRRVIAPGLAAAAEAELGVHLETTNATNLPFYGRLGFDVTHEIQLGSGPTMWAMWRAAEAPLPPIDRPA